jgi:Flp pilus assembly protein TadD
VLAASNLLPLAAATVTLDAFRGSLLATSLTDSEGRFVFRNIPPGRYLVRASHPDYLEQSQWIERDTLAEISLKLVLASKQSPTQPSAQPTIPLWALGIPGPAQLEYDRGLEQLRSGELEESLVHLQAALRIYPQFATARGALGTVHLLRGNMDAAMNAFEHALEIEPNLPAACLGLGSLYHVRHDYQKAEPYLLRARLLKPKDWRIHYELGRLYGRMADWQKAETSLSQARRLHSDFAEVHLLLINALALQTKYVETGAAMEEFLLRFPQHSLVEQVRQKLALLKRELEKNSRLQGSR